MAHQTFILVLTAIFITGIIIPHSGKCQGITYIVNSTGDEHDLDYNPAFNEIGGGDDGKCDVGGGKCTLRAAIENHRKNADNPAVQDPNDPNFYRANKIEFNITLQTGESTAKIMVTDLFRPVLGKLHIDGTTQPGYDPAGGKVIELDGTNAGAGAFCFWLVGKGSIVEGLSIHSFNGRGILISATGGVTSNHIIRNNFIGVDPAGTIDKGNNAGGIYILGSFSTHHNEVSSNFVGGNGGPGIEIDGGGGSSSSAADNTIHSNTIGVTIPNDGEGVLIHKGAQLNIVNNNKISGNKMDGIRISGLSTDKNIVTNNLIGTDAAGNNAVPNEKNGIVIESGSKQNEIGGLTGGGNLVSGNLQSGILLKGTGTNNNHVRNNSIGVNKAENAALGNTNGVEISEGAQLNDIGLKGLEGNQGNLISGNRANGVLISGAQTMGNSLHSNIIGCNRAGNTPLPNGTNGVTVNSGANGNNVGGPFPEHSNLISGNKENGVLITGNAMSNHVSANKIGTNKEGTAALPNDGNGVFLTGGVSNTRVGGFVIEMENIISGNRQNGVLITGEGTDNNDVQYNNIGANANKDAPIPNGANGVAILQGAKSNKIGAVTDEIEILANLIFANKGNGVLISGSGTTGNFIQGNDILFNEANGIAVTSGSQNNFIGETNGLLSEGNVINRNKENGILISGAGTDENTVNANYIGTNDIGGGGLLLPNGAHGVAITQGAKKNNIGRIASIPEDEPAEGNVISGNTLNGVLISGAGTDNNIVQRNYIGTNLLSDMPVPNEGHGVAIELGAKSNTVGLDNLVSGNKGNGVLITGMGTDGNSVAGNKIGTDATGNNALPNINGVAITAGARANRIGGRDAHLSNLISGNTQNGVLITGQDTDDNEVLGNTIGGTQPQSNPMIAAVNVEQQNINAQLVSNGVGILVSDANAINISNNTVTANGKGVVLTGLANGIPISNNTIFNNSNLGIDLGNDGVTGNDEGDADTGPNNLQNFPVITSAVSAGGNTTINGSLNSTPNTTFKLEFFSNAACNISGFGEGQLLLGTHSLTTDATGKATFVAQLTGISVTNGSFITATASDPNNNTSEFSACLLIGGVQLSADLELTKVADKTTLLIGQTVTYTITLRNQGPDAASGVALKDVLPAGLSMSQVSTSIGAYDQNTGVWSVSALGSGSQAILTIVATATQTGIIENTAEVIASGQQDPDSSPNNGVKGEDDQGSILVKVEVAVVNPAQKIEQLISDVNDLETAGKLSSKETKDLVKDLENVLKQINKDHAKQTVQKLEAFIKAVRGLINKGRLSNVEGQSLIGAAQDIIQQLQPGLQQAASVNHVITSKHQAEGQGLANLRLFPNPFSTTTMIFFGVEKQRRIKLMVYDLSGRVITILLDKVVAAGLHNIHWQPKNLTAGVYILQLKTGTLIMGNRMIFVK
jgi:uncharacterized repeat protein (TIGR01451 family)